MSPGFRPRSPTRLLRRRNLALEMLLPLGFPLLGEGSLLGTEIHAGRASVRKGVHRGGSSPPHQPALSRLHRSAERTSQLTPFPKIAERPPWHHRDLHPCPRRGSTYRPAPPPTGYLPLPTVGLDQGLFPPSSRTFLSITGSLIREPHRRMPVATGFAELQPPPPTAHTGSRGSTALPAPAWSAPRAQQLLRKGLRPWRVNG